MFRTLIFIFLIFGSTNIFSQGYDVFSLGVYDFEFDEDLQGNYITSDFRYERRLNKTLLNIGPEEDNFFHLKPFFGIEVTGDSAKYLLGGFYLEDNLGELMINKENNWNFTPSFGLGYYEDGKGKKLGNKLEFRTTLEFSYQFKNLNRVGISIGHISNANIGNKNPGVEIISLSYQKPF